MQKNIRITTLPNKIRVITEKQPDADSISLGVWVGVGSRYETKAQSGISHFLEHMAFKGTTTRSALQIAKEIEDVGGIINAYTGQDMTAYYTRILKKQLPIGLDIISDIVQHSIMDEKELNTEKGVIIQELNMYKDQPKHVAWTNFDETAYPNQPLGRDIGGDPKVIQKMTPKTMLDYMHSHYTTDKIIISAVGDIDPDSFVKKCEKLFTDLSTAPAIIPEPAHYVGGYKYVKKNHEQVNLMLGFEGVSYDSPDLWTSKLLATILGGGMTSRLFQEIREKRGLVYTIHAHSSCESDTGIFYIYAGTGEKEITTLLPTLCDELKKVTSAITDEELIKTKTQLKAALLMRAEEISEHADNNASELLHYGKIRTKEALVKEINAVTKQQIINYAQKLFISKPTISALGPIGNMMPYDKIIERLKG